MQRSVSLLLIAAGMASAHAAPPVATVDIDTAATVYQDAAIREQVRASLGNMPQQIRHLFESDTTSKLNDEQLAAVSSAAKHYFRIDVFEAPALSALAANLDPATAKKAEAFLSSDLGKRMVDADVAIATQPQVEIDKIMSGEVSAPSTPQRDVILDKLEQASHSTESAVQVFLTMGSAVAIGTAVGAGSDPQPVSERSKQAGESSRASLEEGLRQPLRRYLAYSYRELSDDDLKHILSFVESKPGQRYIAANIASMDAGYNAMGRRCGEQLGESLREMAQAKLATTQRDDVPPEIALPAPAHPKR